MLKSFKGLSKPVTMLSLVATLGLVATASQAHAASITPSDLGTAFSGETLSGVAGFPMITVNLINASGTVTGTLGNCVFQDTGKSDADYGQYIYEEKVTTGAAMNGDFSGLTTEFDPAGFTAGVSKAGWNFAGAVGVNSGATGTSSDFSIVQESPSGQLHYASNLPGYAWTTGTSLVFFYESVDGPAYGEYNVQDGSVGEAQSYAPTAVPVPAAASMGLIALAGLAGVGMLRRRVAAV